MKFFTKPIFCFQDMHSVSGSFNNMETDFTQNLRGMFSWEKANETFIIFTRPLITCDDHDINIQVKLFTHLTHSLSPLCDCILHNSILDWYSDLNFTLENHRRLNKSA